MEEKEENLLKDIMKDGQMDRHYEELEFWSQNLQLIFITQQTTFQYSIQSGMGRGLLLVLFVSFVLLVFLHKTTQIFVSDTFALLLSAIVMIGIA